jgi:transcription initiation factor TFIID subunit 7
MIGNESFPASLLDLPAVVESYKTYDDSVLIKTADIGQVKVQANCMSPIFIKFHILKNHLMEHKFIQMIMVREENDPAPEGVEYKHGLTPPMRDARRRRFRREPDLNVIKSIAL